MRTPRSPLLWLSRDSASLVEIALTLLVTFAGLLLFAFAGIGGNTRAGLLFLQSVEQRSLDMRFALRGERPFDERVVIVGIDEKTLQKLGTFPLPRSSYALLVKRLTQSGASIIAFDAAFPTPESNTAQQALERLRHELGPFPSPNLVSKIKQLEGAGDEDAVFADAMKQAGNVVLGHLFLDAERARSTDAKLAEDYFNIIWAKAFPQVLKVESKNGDFDLDQAWRANGGNVYPGAEANLASLAESAASYGFFNINPDPDGTIRRALLIVRYADKDFFPSLAMQVVREYEKIPDQQIAAYISEHGVERIHFGHHRLTPWHDGSVLINYAGPYHTYSHYSMWDVISGALPPHTFQNKIVLVGGTALGIGDLRSTPFERQDAGYMGVEVHANIIDNLLHAGEKNRGFLTRAWNDEIVDIGFILFFGLFFGFLFSRIKPFYSTISLILTLVAFAWFAYFSFVHWGRWLSFVIPAGTLLANYAFITSFRMIFEEGEKRKIRKAFSQYLSPGVIALIERDPKKYIRPGGEIKELTIMFGDIRGFTALSERIPPNELVQLLNEYLEAMTDIVFKNLGTVDKYIGDAIMAFWGSPYPQSDHAFRACTCALEMLRALEELNANWQAQGRPAISIGVGLNTGPVNVGNMGSSKRLSWTVMGDNVNLASRLEGMTKQYRTRIIIGEATYEKVADHFVCRELDKIRVRGKRHPVKIYELLGAAAELPKYSAFLTRFEAALDSYSGHQWREAAGKFGELLISYPDDGPTQIFLQRAVEFLEEAPDPDWDGVYDMKTK